MGFQLNKIRFMMDLFMAIDNAVLWFLIDRWGGTDTRLLSEQFYYSLGGVVNV